MIINRQQCKIESLDHSVINSNMNLFKMISLSFKVGEREIKYYWTNAGWRQDLKQSWFCPAKFYPYQAEKFIDSIESDIELDFDKVLINA